MTVSRNGSRPHANPFGLLGTSGAVPAALLPRPLQLAAVVEAVGDGLVELLLREVDAVSGGEGLHGRELLAAAVEERAGGQLG